MRKAYSFIRFSRLEQRKGDSLRRQREMTTAICKRNGWVLTELKPLEGRSAFRGKQRATGSLADFLKLVESGEIESGSILIVESLDRLTREQVRTAVKFFLSILDAGIDIVTTNPEHHFKAKAGDFDLQDIIVAVVILSRAHEESATKSKRLKERWQQKRLAGTVKKMTHSCPAWLRFDKESNSFQEVPEAVAIIKRIFDLACDGYGVFRICRKLNQEGIPTIGNKAGRKAKYWYESYVIRILRSRSVMGEFQPCVRDERNRSVVSGEPIANYYPAIISEKTFNDARQAINSRAMGVKRTGKFVPNIFGKLLKDARDGSGYLYIPAKAKQSHATVQPLGGRNGTTLPLSFHYAELEKAFLTCLFELKASDLLPKPRHDENKVEKLQGKLADLTGRIATVKKKMDSDSNLDMLIDKLSQWQQEKKHLEEQIAVEQHKNNNPIADALQETKEVIELLSETTDEDKEHLRTKLKQQVTNIVKEIWLLVVIVSTPGSRGRIKKERACIMQIFFESGTVRTIDLQDGSRFVHPNDSGLDLRHYNESGKAFDITITADEWKQLRQPTWMQTNHLGSKSTA